VTELIRGNLKSRLRTQHSVLEDPRSHLSQAGASGAPGAGRGSAQLQSRSSAFPSTHLSLTILQSYRLRTG
jgi:hypothetical protein